MTSLWSENPGTKPAAERTTHKVGKRLGDGNLFRPAPRSRPAGRGRPAKTAARLAGSTRESVRALRLPWFVKDKAPRSSSGFPKNRAAGNLPDFSAVPSVMAFAFGNSRLPSTSSNRARNCLTGIRIELGLRERIAIIIATQLVDGI